MAVVSDVLERQVFITQKKRGWKNCTITVSQKTIAVSSALGEYIGNRIDVYECGNVLAFVNSPEGEYAAFPFAENSNRKIINSRPLARYIQEKYNRPFSLKLIAWSDGCHVLFSLGAADENREFNKSFIKLTETVRLRYENSVRLIGHSFIVSSSLSRVLDDRVSVYEYGDFFAFINDKNGELQVKEHNSFGTKAVHAKKFVHYITSKIGKDPYYGITIKNGIAFSNHRQFDSSYMDSSCFHIADIADLNPQTVLKQNRVKKTLQKEKHCIPYLSIRVNGVIAISGMIDSSIGPWISVYEYKNIIMFVNDEFGSYFFYNVHGHMALTSKELSEYLKSKYNNAELRRLSVCIRDKSLLISDHDMTDDKLPDYSLFDKLHFQERRKLAFEVKVYEGRIHISKRVAPYLMDRITVLEDEEHLLMINDNAGQFRVKKLSKTTEILSKKLARYILRKYNGDSCIVLEARLHDNALLLAPHFKKEVVDLMHFKYIDRSLVKLTSIRQR